MTPSPPTRAPAGPAVRLHIERLVLHGAPFDRRQAGQFQAALETELARLLAGPEFSGGLAAGEAVAGLPPAAVTWGGGSAAALGAEVAGSVYRSLQT